MLCRSWRLLLPRESSALLNFTDGPPFILQRLCEILLSPKTIYPKLLKLALALEKNLLVTSTLNIRTDPYPGKITPGLVEPTLTIPTQTTDGVPEHIEVSKEVSSIQPVTSCPEVGHRSGND